MTAAHTTKVSLSPLALIMFTIAAVSTLLTVPHVVIASVEGWPPQLMTLHAVASVGFWGAGFHYRAKPPTRRAAPDDRPAWEPGPRRRNLDNDLADLAVRDEIDDLERRLRDTDR
jgi:hypothetical protein